jgi:lactoylglutathione lyase
MIKYAYTILYVEDVTKSITFYEKAFGFAIKFITPENDYAELVTGETTLAFASITLANTNINNGFTPSNINHKPFGIEVGFATEQVHETLTQAIEAGATLVSEAKTKPWGQTVAYIRDLDGFLIEICSPMG